jgi:hypothetical protein
MPEGILTNLPIVAIIYLPNGNHNFRMILPFDMGQFGPFIRLALSGAKPAR